MGRQINCYSTEWAESVDDFENTNARFIAALEELPKDITAEQREALMCVLYVICDVDEDDYCMYLENKLIDKLGTDTFGNTWSEGMALIADGNFEEHAQEQADDLGFSRKDFPWLTINWKETAENLQQDYTSIEIEGFTYWGHKS